MTPVTRASMGTTAKIQVQKPDPSEDPIVVSFPGGLPTESSPQFVWRKNSVPSTRTGASRGRTLIGKDETCSYHGKNEGLGYDGRLSKFCVGVFHRPSGTLKLYQAAENGTVFALEQSVGSYTTTLEEKRRLSYVERRKALFEDFGSARKRKMMKSDEANAVRFDSVVGSTASLVKSISNRADLSESNRRAIADSMRGTKTDPVEAAYAESRKQFLPPFDEKAKEPRLVYSIRDMASEDVWDRITRITDACIHKDDPIAAVLERGQWLDSIKEILQTIPLVSQSARSQMKACFLLNYMCIFLQRNASKKSLYGSTEDIARSLRIPVEAAQRFLELFCTNVESESSPGPEYSMSSSQRTRCQLFCLILYVSAHGRKMQVASVQPIFEDLNMDVATASTFLKNAGFTVTKNADKDISASLSVPLTFPKANARSSRRS